jgi:hypothetical protein
MAAVRGILRWMVKWLAAAPTPVVAVCTGNVYASPAPTGGPLAGLTPTGNVRDNPTPTGEVSVDELK